MLFDYQKKVLDESKEKSHVAYFWDMGLGKTFIGAEKAIQLNKTVLIICQKSKIQDWKEHFLKHHAPQIILFDLTKKIELNSFLSMPKNKYISVAIINYELTWRRPQIADLREFTLMLDESSLIQNRKAKQSRFILKLQPENVILLSGTPTSGKYENLWTQAHLLGWGISEQVYNDTYINWKLIDIGGGMKAKIVDRTNPYKKVDRLKRKLREHGAYFMKSEEAIELPKQNVIPVIVPSSPEYRKFMKNGIVKIGREVIVGDTTLTKRLRARQICGQYSTAKFRVYVDLVNSTDDRIIVFYNFDEEVKRLKNINRPLSFINGKVKDLKAYEEHDNAITLVQYQAGSMGLNLQKANKMIFYSLPERSDLFEQAKKRIHRVGQDKKCFYYPMICEGSVEESIYRTLKQRRDYTNELFREEYEK